MEVRSNGIYILKTLSSLYIFLPQVLKIDFYLQVQISMEYPLRPPFFSLSLHTSSGNDNGTSESDHYNELRAMEAEVSNSITNFYSMTPTVLLPS